MRKHRLETLLYQRIKRNYTKVRAGKSRQIKEQRTLRFLFLELASVGVPAQGHKIPGLFTMSETQRLPTVSQKTASPNVNY